MFKHFDKVILIQPIKLFELYQQEFLFVHSSLRRSRSREACLVFPLAYFSCFSCFFRALQKNRALWRLLYLFIMISNFLTKKIMNLNSGHLRCCLVCKLEVWRRDNSVKEQCFSLFGGESFKASLHLENTVRWVNFLFTLGLFIC